MIRGALLTSLVAVPLARALPSSRRSSTALIAAARRQVGVTTAYDPGYSVISYPNGDVARSKGVCIDVVIQAYRDAFGVDLQVLVHADMERAFDAYPHSWGLRAPDSNIDHRRAPNPRAFLPRRKAEAALPFEASGWRPGDTFSYPALG